MQLEHAHTVVKDKNEETRINVNQLWILLLENTWEKGIIISMMEISI